jgi:aminoglycoside phosphotransferase (APT) family kinase protein
MAGSRMHVDEVETDEALVGRLLAEQFPAWAALPIQPVTSSGTDNALYRLGDEMLVRLARIHWAAGQVEKESLWLPRLAPHLPVTIPVPLAIGAPGEGFPWTWGIYPWLPGKHETLDTISNPDQAARDLAAFIRALQQIDAAGGPPGSRGKPLAERDGQARQSIAALQGEIDSEKALAVWEAAVQAPPWDQAPLWFHGDLLPGNLLFQQGRLSAIIDFGTLGVGDPACDLMVAWNTLPAESRSVFRAALGVDDATWARGRGWALWQALVFIPYYLHTNPVGVGYARRTLEEVLADYG